MSCALNDYSYDVAFSFLAEDERHALAIKEKLSPALNVFLYNELQDELAGADGLVQLSNVFRHDARIIVVLYRENWGATVWTGVEQTAITDRGITQGWDFVLVISLDSGKPRWLPETKLFYLFERFGAEMAAGAIEERVRQAGGDPREESAVERAVRLARWRVDINQRIQKEQSPEAIQAAHVAVNVLIQELERLSNEITEKCADISQAVRVQFHREPEKARCVNFSESAHPCDVKVIWSQGVQTRLRGSLLKVEQYCSRRNERSGEWIKSSESIYEYEFRIDEQSDTWVWRRKGQLIGELTSAGLAENIIKRLLDLITLHLANRGVQ